MPAVKTGVHGIRTLPNGATLVAQKPRSGGGWVVLAYNGGVQPWVCWVMDREDNCWWGHYHGEYEAGLAAFLKRD